MYPLGVHKPTMRARLLLVVSFVVNFKIHHSSNTVFLQKFMQFNLTSPGEETFSPTDSRPEANSSDTSNDSNVPTFDLGHSPVCPSEMNIFWQLRPPFTSERNDSKDKPTDGIFHQALDFALGECCQFYRGNKPVMRYLEMTDNSTSLRSHILADETSLVFPVQEDWFIGRMLYINVLDSPGVVLIRRETFYSTERRTQLLKAIFGTWPIVILSLLLSSVAGIFIWMLETRTNKEEFGRPFYRGAFDGFWWAFVTMSTVGYGDKTPKSIGGRLFSVVWIITGITVCSVLTATLASALTNVTVERYDVTATKTIGAQKESFAFKQAVNLGANVAEFENLQEAFFSLENGSVEGILEEMFTGIEFMKRKRNEGLSVAQVFERQHYYGAGIKRDGFSAKVLDCLQKVVNFVSEDIYSNTSRLLKSFKHFDESSSQMSETPTDSANQNYNGLFDHSSVSFKATVIGISVTLVLFMTCSSGFAGIKHLRRKISKEPVDLEAGVK